MPEPEAVARPAAVPIASHIGGTQLSGVGLISGLKADEVAFTPFRNLGGRLGGLLPPPFGPLENFQGYWVGTGFNTIWRPNFAGAPGAKDTEDHFLALNLTAENLTFTPVSTAVPNRGLSEPDISLAAVEYLQKISDANFPPPAGGGALHFEPGLWLVVPGTADTGGKQTVNRLGSVPHGTTLLAVGTSEVINGPPTIDPVSITPFSIGSPGSLVAFPEQSLANSAPTSRTDPLPAGITQALVDNPNSLLTNAIAQMSTTGLTLTSTTQLQVATINPLGGAGGGTDAIPFLNAASSAQVAEVSSTFWLETWSDRAGGTCLTLQYTQTVLLNFNTLSWPHVTVGSLTKAF